MKLSYHTTILKYKNLWNKILKLYIFEYVFNDHPKKLSGVATKRFEGEPIEKKNGGASVRKGKTSSCVEGLKNIIFI